MKKEKIYCAFGIGYFDCKGEIVEESENYFIVRVHGMYKLALPKDNRLTKIFDSEEKRDDWIKKQDYQYDPR